MNDGDILETEREDSYISNLTHVWERVQLKVEAIDDSKLQFLPHHQCPDPDCGDIGQCIYQDPASEKTKWIFYCPYCHTHYYIRYHSEERRTTNEDRR